MKQVRISKSQAQRWVYALEDAKKESDEKIREAIDAISRSISWEIVRQEQKGESK